MIASRLVVGHCGVLAAGFIVVAICTASAAGTALDDYVAAPDSHYTYQWHNTIAGMGYTAYVLEVTSQAWRTSAEVDRTIWKHWLTIIRPNTVEGTKSLLWITGGANTDPAPTSVDSNLAAMAVLTHTVVSELRMVPNQPLYFTDENRSRDEDEIIAYTFDKYMVTCDGTWPALLPMVKSAVRAMDTIQAYVPTVTGGAATIDKFIVTGASKRGWTTWLTAAVDTRVLAIMPLVIDALRLDKQLEHHYAAYGFFAPALHDYVDMHVTDRIDTPEGQALLLIVDPYEYRTRYASLPKYMISATGDQFFLPDSAQFYVDDLPGEKYLRSVPNTDHSLSGSDVPASMQAFYVSLLTGAPRPQFSWTFQADGSIHVQTVTAPSQVNLWQATATNARDFRLEIPSPPVWSNSPLADQGGGVYVAGVPTPAVGWTGFFAELVFNNAGGVPPYRLTTPVRVVPDCLPYACDFDRDRDVDQEDFGHFQVCLTGGVEQTDPVCSSADLNNDGYVDQADFAVFESCAAGPGVPPACLLHCE